MIKDWLKKDKDVSIKGKVVSDMISHVTNDLLIGRKIKSGELRKRLVEPNWIVPGCFILQDIDMGKFKIKYLMSKEKPSKKGVILQLHGGGYMGAIRNAYYVFAGLYNEVSKGYSVATPDYRVAPENPFPAALEDAVATYMWLVEKKGFKENEIVIVGDSAGGGLAMALAMYIRDNNLPRPKGIVAMSPWTDLTASGESYTTNFHNDVLFGNTKESLIYENYYAKDEEKTNPYVSPLFGSFKDFPPMLIQAGSNEMLLSDSIEVAKKAKNEKVKVRLSIYEGMFHVFQMGYLNFPESKAAWKEVRAFFRILDKNKKFFE
ncbi:MAG: alpha/beta hydrolase [Agathobacter sp.]|nr:alpha/beta hydrolase [Agathobacter sp.]